MSTDKTKTDHVTGGKDKDETAQAAGGVNETDDAGRILPLEQIRIFEVFEDSVPIQSPLLNCFFSPEGPAGEYMFFGPGGKMLHGQVRDDEDIKVEIDGRTWHLTTHFHPHEGKAHGKWKIPKDGEAEEGGTFTAQAGGGVATSAYA